MSAISPFPVFKQAPVILVVDDDKTMRVLLRKIMENEGYGVIEVSDGQQCLAAYQSVKPDIVLLDAVMPVMDGFTCCEQLVKVAKNDLISGLRNFDIDLATSNSMISKLWEHTPILMLTSLDDEDSVNRAFDAGATDYITKPIKPIILCWRLRQLLKQIQVHKQLQAANQSFHQLANVYSLTGLANRRCFDNYLNTQWINLIQEESPLSLILCDIDFFKNYNDKYGHPLGDSCLQKVASALNCQTQKPQDLVARYGGEEFAVILPNTDKASAICVGKTLQAQVRDLQIIHDGSAINQYVTLSLGVATLVPTWESLASDLVE